jgi:ubiquinone/menaquinone biosynthesis C-methylase UbiE
MPHQKFDVSKIERLEDRARFDSLDPDVMWSALGSPSPRVIVDIGAGTGLFARRFAAMAPDATVFAADTAPVMLRWIEEHPDPVVGERIKPLLAEESKVPLPDGTADLAVMINLHHELIDPAASYREAFRLLRRGGQFLVVDWSPGNTEGGPPQHIRATPEQIVDLLESAGFVEAVSFAGLPKHSIVTARKNVP